jgi:hypothetical protein
VGRLGPTWYAGEFRGGRRCGRGVGLWLSEDGFNEGVYDGEWWQVSSAEMSMLFHGIQPVVPRHAGKAAR